MYNPCKHIINSPSLQGVPPNYNGNRLARDVLADAINGRGGAPAPGDFAAAIDRMRAEDAAADARMRFARGDFDAQMAASRARDQVYANDPMSQPGSPRLPYPPPEDMEIEGAPAPFRGNGADRAINPDETNSPEDEARFQRNLQRQVEIDQLYVPPSQLLARNGGPLTADEINQYLPEAIQDARYEAQVEQIGRRGRQSRQREIQQASDELLRERGNAMRGVEARLGRDLSPEEEELMGSLVAAEQAPEINSLAEEAIARQRAYTQRLTQQTNFG